MGEQELEGVNRGKNKKNLGWSRESETDERKVRKPRQLVTFSSTLLNKMLGLQGEKKPA